MVSCFVSFGELGTALNHNAIKMFYALFTFFGQNQRLNKKVCIFPNKKLYFIFIFFHCSHSLATSIRLRKTLFWSSSTSPCTCVLREEAKLFISFITKVFHIFLFRRVFPRVIIIIMIKLFWQINFLIHVRCFTF